MTIDWQKIQQKWQLAWDEAEVGKASVEKNKEKFFLIFAYPGISGYPHVGHMRGYSYTDMIGRYERLRGKEVLFPVGTHASGNQALAFANKIKNNDKQWIDYLLKNGCTKEKIKELTEPEKIIEYFNSVFVNDYFKKFGFICDWQRFTCTTFPDYEKFIQWQFKKLQQRNLLVQKPYFAPACIKDGPVAVDPSETDISKGGKAEKQEYTLLKFKIDDYYLIAATLRPETIYGQTNLWVNPEATYVLVDIEGEQWVLSKEAAEKLPYQKDDVLLKQDIDITKFIGRTALAPGVEKEIIILPADFVDAKVGSGIVTSVPADAPYDYVALKQLQQDDKTLKKYGLEEETIKKLTPIPIINSKGYGPFPAEEIVQKKGITELDDSRLEETTKEIYKVGYHTGVMRDTCGEYAGMKVEEAKELMKAALLEAGRADIFHDLSEEVICRCGERVVISRIDDQWFIRYSDPELTERSKEQVKEMQILPKEYGQHLPAVLDWFMDRACVRLGNWLGSKFPFDDRWIVEPISDSTLYPAYYIVSKFVNDGTINVKELTEQFFDYVFLGDEKGKIKKSWKTVREEFLYFYPLDVNLGGKEHKTVHFPVFLMNHVAILPKEQWPKGIFVNWWVTGKGNKISKSKGGAEPIPDAIEKYGVDAMRLYYAHIGSPHVDVVWDDQQVFQYRTTLERIFNFAEELKELDREKKLVDDWLESRMHQHIKEIKGAMKCYDLRILASLVYYTIYDDLRWYIRRGGANKRLLAKMLSVWCRLMNPITPHLSEELNELLGTKEKLVSTASWPLTEESKISYKAEASEELIRRALTGMRAVVKLAKVKKANKFTLFIAESWLYDLYGILSKELKVTRNTGEVMRRVLAEPQMKIKGKEVSKIVLRVSKDPTQLPNHLLSREDELKVMQEAEDFLAREFSCVVEVISESEHAKAKSAMPGKIGILLE